jgi:hypothetical protein
MKRLKPVYEKGRQETPGNTRILTPDEGKRYLCWVNLSG